MTIGQKQALGTQMPRREYFGDIPIYSQQPGLVPTFIVPFLTINYPTGDAPGLAAPA